MDFNTVEARKLEYDSPMIPKQKQQGTPAEIILNPYSNFLGSNRTGCLGILVLIDLPASGAGSAQAGSCGLRGGRGVLPGRGAVRTLQHWVHSPQIGH